MTEKTKGSNAARTPQLEGLKPKGWGGLLFTVIVPWHLGLPPLEIEAERETVGYTPWG